MTEVKGQGHGGQSATSGVWILLQRKSAQHMLVVFGLLFAPSLRVCAQGVFYNTQACPLTLPPPAPLYDLPDGVFTLTAERALWGSVTIGQLQAEIRIGFISQWRLFCEKATKGLLGGGKGQADEAHCCPADEQILAGSCGQQAGRGLGYSLASCRAAPFEMHLDLQVPTTLLIFVVFLPCFGVFWGGVRHKYLFCGSVTYMDVLYSNMDLKHIYLNYVI